jgi:hypothetical protein
MGNDLCINKQASEDYATCRSCKEWSEWILHEAVVIRFNEIPSCSLVRAGKFPPPEGLVPVWIQTVVSAPCFAHTLRETIISGGRMMNFEMKTLCSQNWHSDKSPYTQLSESVLFCMVTRIRRDYNGSYITLYGPYESFLKEAVRVNWKWLWEERDDVLVSK